SKAIEANNRVDGLADGLVYLVLIDAHHAFFSSMSFGSHNSTLLPSGSMIHANFPFTSESGPLMISIPPSRSCAIISSRLSTRSLIMKEESLGLNHLLSFSATC